MRDCAAVPSRRSLKYRRAPAVVLYWEADRLFYDNYILGKKLAADPIVCSILDYCHEWRNAAEVCAHLGKIDRRTVTRALDALCRACMLQRSDAEADRRERALAGWRNWNPAAGFFHFSTKDVDFAKDPIASFRALQKRAQRMPMPQVGKRYPRAPRVELEGRGSEPGFPQILRDRRTWRKFSLEPVSIGDLAKLLYFTFGVQSWGRIPDVGRMAIKTSPSGGGLHPIEAYVLARRVDGLRQGIYYYDAAKDKLAWLRRAVSRQAQVRMMANQWWFGDAAFVVFMTAVFGRTQWKYDFPRAYRVVLLEAGHLGQTFCLTATWLGLAPFSTAAFADTKWETLLGIDGIRESVLYAVGAGKRPADENGAHIGKSAAGLPNWG